MKWYYIFSRDYNYVVLDYYMAKDNTQWEKAETFIKEHKPNCEHWDVMGGFNTRKEAMDDALQYGKDEYQA